MARRRTTHPNQLELNLAEVEAWVTASRAAQGLPPRIDDPLILARVAHRLVGAQNRPATVTQQPAGQVDRAA